MKPMLADDAVEEKLRFPALWQPKIDGVRGLHVTGRFTGRSLKPFGNRYTNEFFSHPHFAGFDGELAAAHECDPELCRKTSSATSTHAGKPFLLWWLFDYVTPATMNLPYHNRYQILNAHVEFLMGTYKHNVGHLRVVPSVICNSYEEFLALDTKALDEGYEGSIYRALDKPHKQGRSTVREGGLLRVKRFIEEEAVVITIIEGDRNDNEAQKNELGQTFRSTHQANMVPNGMVGAMLCKNLKDSKTILVGAGRMPHDQRKYYFENQQELLGKIIKYQHFPKGVKDKPRFPTFQCIRAPEDM